MKAAAEKYEAKRSNDDLTVVVKGFPEASFFGRWEPGKGRPNMTRRSRKHHGQLRLSSVLWPVFFLKNVILTVLHLLSDGKLFGSLDPHHT